MTIINNNQRGFVLKEGFLKPGDTLTIDAETAEKLVRMYPKDLKVIHTEEKAKEAVKEEVKVSEVEEPKKSRGRKKKDEVK